MNARRITSAATAALLLALVVDTDSRAGDADVPQPPGKIYEIGGHKMHLNSSGDRAGGPSVVLEAGAGAFSLDWYLVQQEVAKFAKVCSYDRAGHAWSEVGPRPRTMRQAVYDLHCLLATAGFQPPYVMVGHSLGGTLVRVYAAEYPNEVAGMVLVDAGIDNSPLFINGKMEGAFDNAKPRQIPAPREQIRDDERTLSKAELDGYEKFLEVVGKPSIEAPFDKLPQPIQKLRLWAMSLPQSNVTDYDPFGSEEALLLFADRIRTEHPLGNRPLVVLERKSDEKRHTEGEESFGNLSGNSAIAMSAFPIHEIQLAQPGLVVAAIHAVIESVKTGEPVKMRDAN